MKSNSTMVPEAKEAMNRFKMESASEVGVNLKQGYNGDLTSRQAGSIGGQMVKKYINKLKSISYPELFISFAKGIFQPPLLSNGI